VSKFKTSNKCKLFQKERKEKFEIFILRLSNGILYKESCLFLAFSKILFGLTV